MRKGKSTWLAIQLSIKKHEIGHQINSMSVHSLRVFLSVGDLEKREGVGECSRLQCERSYQK